MKRLIRAAAKRLGVELARYPSEDTFDGELYRLLAGTGPEVFLDIGAHLGESSRLVRSLGFQGPILAFEPDEACLPELRALAAGDPAWQVFPVALGRAAGTASLFRMDGSGLSSLRAPLPDPGDGSLRPMRIRDSTTVQIRTLKDVLERDVPVARSVMAKIDAQGFDLEIMEGAGGERGRIVAAVLEAPLVELYDGMHSLEEALDRMHEWGYDVTGLVPISRDGAGRIIEVDVFFSRRRPRPANQR